TDDARQVRRSESAVEGADARTGLTETGVVRGDGQIADDVQHMPAADRVSGDHGHDRFRQAANLLLHVEDVQPGHGFRVNIARLAANALVAAGAERLFALAGEDDDADVGIIPGHVEGFFQLVHRLWPKCVAHLGTIDRDLADSVPGPLVADVFEWMQRGPHGARLYARQVRGPIDVYKFGGAAVGSAEAVRLAGAHVRRSRAGLVVVISAMQGVTDVLLDAARSAQLGQSATLDEFVRRHID